MTIMQINEKRTKITLSHVEVISCFGTYERLKSSPDSVKFTIRALLCDILNGYAAKYNDCRLLARVRAEQNCGCEITLSVIEKECRGKVAEYVFDFCDSENLTKAVKVLYGQKDLRNLESSLYKMSGGYRLIVKTSENTQRLFIINEFSSRKSDSRTVVEYTREHGRLLIENNAIEKYGSAFFKEP